MYQLKSLRISRVAMVDKPDNPPAEIMLFKRRQYDIVRDLPVPMTKAAMLESMYDQVAGLNRHTAEANARLDALMGVTEDGEDMSSAVWKELTARCLEWDTNDTNTNNAFVGAVVKVFGGAIIPGSDEIQKLAKSDRVGFTKSDVERFAAMLGGASAWDQYPAVTAMWEHASLDKRETAEPITKSWTEQSAAERAEALLNTMATEQAEQRGIAKELAYSKLVESDEGRLLFEASQSRGVSPKQFVKRMLERYEATKPVQKVAEALGSDWR